MRSATVRSDLNAEGDGLLKNESLADELGRTVETRQYETGSEYIGVKQTYDAMGRVSQVSNPYRSGDTVVWTTTTYDTLGRMLTVTTPDNAVVSTGYSGVYTTVTDQAGKVRRSKMNALGQLVRVDEPDAGNDPGPVDTPAQSTSYTYDVLGNLTQVNQGTQTRTFAYSSLSRLTSAVNPESGTIGYLYDANGNLTQKTDARSVATGYAYDGLNRPTSRNYSDGTPTVTYAHDTLTNGKGRLTSVSSSVSATNYSGYDAVGKVAGSSQITDGQTYTMTYGYNLAGAMTSETYPSGRVVTTAYDDIGRLSAVTGQKSGEANKTYASTPTFTAHGAIKDLKLGNNLWEHTNFNTRLQPTEIGLGTTQSSIDRLKLNYAYGTTTNNGNVQSQTITIPSGPTITQSYTYDSLNRLKSAEEMNPTTQSWKQTFLYDRFGNRTFDADTTKTTANALSSTLTISSTTNRINTGQGSIHFDSAGNLDVDYNGHAFGYDGENKQITYDGGSSANGTDYKYDGDGRRIKKVTGTSQATTVFVYDAMGQLVAEYDTATQQGNGGTSYLTNDTLGTPRIITDSGGGVKSRRDYMPFGEEVGLAGGRTAPQGYVTDNVKQKFTQYERDIETGLDFAQARYYSSQLGSFSSTDPLMASGRSGLPQSWNRYAYVLNNPLLFTDPTGLGEQGGMPIIHEDRFVTERTETGTIEVRAEPRPDLETKHTWAYQLTGRTKDEVGNHLEATVQFLAFGVDQGSEPTVPVLKDAQPGEEPDEEERTAITDVGGVITETPFIVSINGNLPPQIIQQDNRLNVPQKSNNGLGLAGSGESLINPPLKRHLTPFAR